MPPTFSSLALEQIPDPDFAEMAIGVLPAHATADPAAWARSLASLRGKPAWIIALMGLAQAAARLLGARITRRDLLRVRYVVGDEALLAGDDRHLDLRVGIGVDEARNLVRVVLAVRLKGWRGRIYFWPVRLLYPVVMRSLIRHSQKSLSGATS